MAVAAHSDPTVEAGGLIPPSRRAGALHQTEPRRIEIRVGILQIKNHLEAIEGGEVDEEAETRPP
jgi:hypothetical protein